MGDVHSPEQRSFNMSRIRSKDTKPEILVRRFLFSKGFRYRLHVKKLPGKPDIVLPKYKIAIYIHGCFWHGHDGCRYFVIPKTRTEWWHKKIMRNKELDRSNSIKIKSLGWEVLEIYECSLRKDKFEGTSEKILRLIKKNTAE